jgi:hypothetical protein
VGFCPPLKATRIYLATPRDVPVNTYNPKVV